MGTEGTSTRAVRLGSMVEVQGADGQPRPAVVTHVFSPTVINVVAFRDGSYDPGEVPPCERRTSLRWDPALPDTVSWRNLGEFV